MSKRTQRWILPYTKWPEAHCKAWQAAIHEGDVFSDRGLASRWTDKTRNQIVKDYGMRLQ